MSALPSAKSNVVYRYETSCNVATSPDVLGNALRPDLSTFCIKTKNRAYLIQRSRLVTWGIVDRQTGHDVAAFVLQV